MKKWLKLICIMVVVIMVFTVELTGCGQGQDTSKDTTVGISADTSADTSVAESAQDVSKPDISKEVKLQMVLFGDKPKAYDTVYGELNKLMKEDINATVNVEFIAWGDLDTKYPLLFAAGEALDMVYTANWYRYNHYASSGAFMALSEEMIKKAGPLTWEKQKDVAFEQAKVNGKIYMVPNDGTSWAPYKLLAIRRDLREKYGIPEIKTAEGLEQFFDAVVQKENGIFAYPSNNSGTGELRGVLLEVPNSWYEILKDCNYMIKFTDEKPVPFFLFDTPEFMAYARKMRDWYNKGYWSKNAYANKTTIRDAWINSTSASNAQHLSQLVAESNQLIDNNSAVKVEIIDLNPGAKKMASLYTQDGIAIASSSKNAERSLMLLDLLKYSKSYFDLTWYGIKDVHYEEVNGMIKTLPASDDFPFKNVCPWAWKSSLELEAYSDNPEKNELNVLKEKISKQWFENDLLAPKAQNFYFDNTNVKNELAAVGNLLATEGLVIQLGMVDPETAIPALIEQCKKVGLEKIDNEIKAQMEAFLDQ